MDRQLWQRIELLFGQVLELPIEQRSAFLDRCCGRDVHLRQEVEGLLGSHEQADAFLAKPLLAKSSVANREPTFSRGGGEPDSLARSRFPPGVILAGRYRISEVLGRGGMGEVYRAEDLELTLEVALKFLPEPQEQDQGALRRFVGEIRIARRITHPNVCRVYDLGEVDGHYFLSMEYIDGEDLASLLRRIGRPPPRLALEIARQLVDGLAAVHRQGILFRDLKPANVMIDTRGKVRLADFGIAAPVESVSGIEVLTGTRAYMAPEQLAGQEVTVKSDLYALGLVLYELCTGCALADAPELAVRGRRQPSFVLRQRLAATPELERVILGLLQLDPSLRPASAQAVAELLTRDSHASGDRWKAPREAGEGVHLRYWSAPRLPAEPYPWLLPYAHPQLLAGRSSELAELQRLLRLPIPILGLSGLAGVGKSSLLIAGLVPLLRARGQPVAFDDRPHVPGLATRLLDDLLIRRRGCGLGAADPQAFMSSLLTARSLADKAPILVLDQIEQLLRRADRRRARAELGVLLAASARRQPGLEVPSCRWLLSYRQEVQGEVISWLRSILEDARREGMTGIGSLATDLSGIDRFHSWTLPVLATRAATATAVDARRVFGQVIDAPTAVVTSSGHPAYPWRLGERDSSRLASFFADLRQEQPDVPLAAQVQLMLACLFERGRQQKPFKIELPRDLDAFYDAVLEQHVVGVLATAFPALSSDEEVARQALRFLAGGEGDSPRCAGNADLEQRFGDTGSMVMERLAAPLNRLVFCRQQLDGWSYTLSDARLRQVILSTL